MPQVIAGIEYYDGDEVSRLLGIKKATLYAYISRGLLHSYRQAVGRRRLYRRDEVDQLLAVRSTTSAHSPERPQGAASLPDAASWIGDH
jgi:excisionase family DNA binding protein